MTLRDANRVRGSVFDIEALGALPATNCNVLFVSDRTLSLMQTIARNEVNFLSRYAKSFEPGGYYIPVDLSDTAEVDIAESVALNYRLEVIDVSCDVVGALEELTLAVSVAGGGCGCDVGVEADNEEGVGGGSVPSDIGGFSYAAETDGPTRRCRAANWIYFSVKNVLTQFIANGVEDMGFLGIAVVMSIISGIIGTVALGPFGGLLGVVAGAVVAVAANILKVGVDISAALTQFTTGEDGLICTLIDASSVSEARSLFASRLDSEGVTALNKAVIMVMLSNSVLNVLFFDQEESDDFFDTYSPPNPCQGCSASGPFSHWTLDEASGTRVDSVGSNDLTDNNTVTGATGKVDESSQFTRANNESLTVANDATLQMGSDQSFTIAAWVYLDSKPATAGVVTKWNSNQKQEYSIEYKGGGTDRFRFLISTNGQDSGHKIIAADTFGSPSTGTWYHIVAWFSDANEEINIQINDGAEDSLASASGAFSSDTELAIGCMQDTGSRTNFFDGRVDDVKIWKRTLSEAERDAMYF